MKNQKRLLAYSHDQLLEACKLAFEELKPNYRAWGENTVMGKLERAIRDAESLKYVMRRA